jgi:hypothetical protein
MPTQYHVLFILLGIGWVLLNDLIGILWMSGIVRSFHMRFLIWQHRLISFLFVASLVSGIALVISKSDVIHAKGFWIKMAFVTMTGGNGHFMARKSLGIAGQRFREAPTRAKLGIMAGAALSLFLWLATALMGLFGMKMTW